MRQATHFAVQPGWKLLLRDMGYPPEQLLQLAGLPADLFARKDARITPDEYFRLWQALESSAGTRNLPLQVGQAISVEAFDPPIFASLCSPNLNIAMQRLSAFKRLVGPMTLNVEVGTDATTLELSCYGDAGPIPCSLAMSELVFLTQLARIGTRCRIAPLQVSVPMMPGAPDDYADYFGTLPLHGPSIRLVFSRTDALRPFLTENAAMWAFFEPELQQRLSTMVAASSMAERVKAVLLEALPAGAYSVDHVARQLAVSKRTLQRQLGEEATSFMQVLSTTRHQLALHYLKAAQVSLGEIAFLLGFQEVNSFLRAFREWTGRSPSAYRSEQPAS